MEVPADLLSAMIEEVTLADKVELVNKEETVGKVEVAARAALAVHLHPEAVPVLWVPNHGKV